MTWRRFTTLLRGLGPHSASFSRAQIRRAMERRASKVVAITTPEQAEQAFVSLFRPPEKGKRNTH